MKNYGKELFGLVERDQGYSFVSDAISGLPKERVLAIARGALKHTEATATNLRRFLKKYESESDSSFVEQHPAAKALGPKQLALAISIADRHENIRVYRSNGEVRISREAMHSPGLREPFIVRGVGEAKR